MILTGVDIALFVLGMLLIYIIALMTGMSLERPKFLCNECDKEVGHGVEYCSKCGRKLDWENIELNDAVLPIFLGKWRIKL